MCHAEPLLTVCEKRSTDYSYVSHMYPFKSSFTGIHLVHAVLVNGNDTIHELTWCFVHSGVAVGPEFCGPESPALRDPSVWMVSIGRCGFIYY